MKTSTLRLAAITVRCPNGTSDAAFRKIMLDLDKTHGIDGEFEYGTSFYSDGSSDLHLWRGESARPPRLLREIMAMAAAENATKRSRKRDRNRRVH